MEIKYTRKHSESFMSISGDVQFFEHERRMIEANKIRILLEQSNMIIDGVTQYNYNISRKENVQDYLESRDYSLEAIEKLVLNLQIGLTELEKYLIDEQHILLEKETMFLEKENGSYRLSLCYYPIENGTIQEQFRKLIEHIIASMSGQDRETAKHIYEIYDICLKDDYTLGEILDYLQSNTKIEDEIVVNKIVFENEYDCEENQIEEYNDSPSEDLYDYYEEKEKTGLFVRLSPDSIKGFFKRLINRDRETSFASSLKFEDFVIEPETEIDEKTVLLKDSKPAGKLVYDGHDSEDDYIITKDVFKIGSSKTNDAVLKSRAVSSNHAKIYRENGNYFLEDLNSLNGSFIGNTILGYRQKVKLKTMDVIKFADVTYVFM